MRNHNLEYTIHAAATYKADPIAAAAVKATEVGVVVPSLFRNALVAAGFTVVDDDDEHAKSGYRKLDNKYRCTIRNKGGVDVAHAISGDATDALLHALHGYLIELDVAAFGARLANEIHRCNCDGGTLPEKLRKANWAMTDEHRANFDNFIKALAK